MHSPDGSVMVGFFGGPLDGWCDERTTDESVFLPEYLVSTDHRHPGRYEIELHCEHHWLYRWREGVGAEA